MRLLLSTTIVATLLHTAVALGVETPNVILILTDDQGYSDLSCHGNPMLTSGERLSLDPLPETAKGQSEPMLGSRKASLGGILRYYHRAA